MRPTVRLMVAVLLLALVGACSSSGPAAHIVQQSPTATTVSEAWPTHPCSLVPVSEIAGVVGGSVQAGTESTWAHGSMCSFSTTATYPVPATTTTNVEVPIAGITITFVDQPTFDARIDNVGPLGTDGQVPLFNKKAIPSLGSQAWQITGIHFAEVVVVAGRYRVWVDAYAGKGELWELELQLAPAVVPSIGAAA